MVGTQHPQAPKQNGHFLRGQTQQLRPVQQHLFGANGVSGLLPVAEPVGQRLKHVEGLSIGFRIACVATARRKRHISCKACRLNRLFQTDIACQNDQIRHRGTGFRRNRLQNAQNLGQTLGLIAFPVFLRCQTDAGPVGPAPHVRAAESPRAVPCGCDQVGCRQTALRNLGLNRRNVIRCRACRDRILPDQVFPRDIGADIIDLRSHVAVG